MNETAIPKLTLVPARHRRSLAAFRSDRWLGSKEGAPPGMTQDALMRLGVLESRWVENPYRRQVGRLTELGERYVAAHLTLHEEWPVHQPAAPDAPIPGRHWYAGCEPGGDWDSELGRYTGIGPRVNPATGVCEGCGEHACPTCGRQDCPDHP